MPPWIISFVKSKGKWRGRARQFLNLDDQLPFIVVERGVKTLMVVEVQSLHPIHQIMGVTTVMRSV